MKAYLIDFENVKSKGLTGIEGLGENDRVIIFYSENSDTISFEMHCKVMTSAAQIEYLKVKVGGKNALDFQLSTLLGFMVAKETYSHIFVISGDKGFDKLHDFWNCAPGRECHSVVFRSQNIGSAIAFANSPSGRRKADMIAEYDEQEQPAVSDFDILLPQEDNEPQAAAANAPMDEAGITLDELSADSDTDNNNNNNNNVNSEYLASEAKHEKAVQHEIEGKTLPIDILSEEHELAWGAPVMETVKAEPQDNVTITKIPAPRRGRKPRTVSVQIRNSLQGLFDFEPEDVETIKNCLDESDSKEDFHNSMAKIFKQQAGEIYKILRPKYLRLKALLIQEKGEQSAEPQTNDAADEENAERSAEPEKAAVSQTKEKANKAAKDIKNSNAKISPHKEHKDSTKLYAEVERLLKDECSREEIDTVAALVEKTDTKQRLYLSIVKEYKKNRGCEIYKLLKPEYSSLEKLKTAAAI